MTRRKQSNKLILKKNKFETMVDRLRKDLSTISITKMNSTSNRSLKEILNDFQVFNNYYQREYRTIGIGSDEIIENKHHQQISTRPQRTICTRSLKLKNLDLDTKTKSIGRFQCDELCFSIFRICFVI